MRDLPGCCILCRCFHPVPPAGWRPPHEYHEQYDIFDVRTEMKASNGRQRRGQCRLNPTAVDVWTSDTCSHFKPIDYAIMTMQEFLWGSLEQRQLEEKEAKVVTLTRQLRVARERSNERLARLQKLKPPKSASNGFDGRDHTA